MKIGIKDVMRTIIGLSLIFAVFYSNFILGGIFLFATMFWVIYWILYNFVTKMKEANKAKKSIEEMLGLPEDGIDTIMENLPNKDVTLDESVANLLDIKQPTFKPKEKKEESKIVVE